jgi:hypothetical protein
VRLRLDAATAPELHAQVDAEEVQRHLLLIEDLCRTGWTALRLAPPREFASLGERNPQLELVHFDALAAWAGYTPRSLQWQAQWLRHLQAHWMHEGHPAPQDVAALIEYLARNPLLALQDLPFDEATLSLARLRALCASGRRMPLREASALAFQGRSKLLDNRDELLRLLGASTGQLLEPPIQLLLAVPQRFDHALFVENLVTFERMADVRKAEWGHSLLVFAAGFRGSARRLRTREGCRLYFRNAAPADGAAAPIEDWLFDGAELPVFFFGDLDYAGMQILSSFRSVFPGAQAWAPGYARLATILQRGGGHRSGMADKESQVDPGSTGCALADKELLALMRQCGRFVDQEAFAVD